MPELMKELRTDADVVVTIRTGKVEASYSVPGGRVRKLLGKLRPMRQRSVDDDTVPWREALGDRIADGGEPATMLRGARVREGITQKQLAEALGIKQSHISEMENGKRPIGKEMARRLGDVLRVGYKVFL